LEDREKGRIGEFMLPLSSSPFLYFQRITVFIKNKKGKQVQNHGRFCSSSQSFAL
jgi:hypothetical protein